MSWKCLEKGTHQTNLVGLLLHVRGLRGQTLCSDVHVSIVPETDVKE